jgi:hypothetical protein
VSTDEDKFNRSQRIAKQDNAVKKQMDIAKSHGVPAEVPHKFAKRHAMNCGNPSCHMCGNPRKVFNELSIQEKRMFQDLDEPNND